MIFCQTQCNPAEKSMPLHQDAWLQVFCDSPNRRSNPLAQYSKLLAIRPQLTLHSHPGGHFPLLLCMLHPQTTCNCPKYKGPVHHGEVFVLFPPWNLLLLTLFLFNNYPHLCPWLCHGALLHWTVCFLKVKNGHLFIWWAGNICANNWEIKWIHFRYISQKWWPQCGSFLP